VALPRTLIEEKIGSRPCGFDRIDLTPLLTHHVSELHFGDLLVAEDCLGVVLSDEHGQHLCKYCLVVVSLLELRRKCDLDGVTHHRTDHCDGRHVVEMRPELTILASEKSRERQNVEIVGVPRILFGSCVVEDDDLAVMSGDRHHFFDSDTRGGHFDSILNCVRALSLV